MIIEDNTFNTQTIIYNVMCRGGGRGQLNSVPSQQLHFWQKSACLLGRPVTHWGARSHEPSTNRKVTTNILVGDCLCHGYPFHETGNIDTNTMKLRDCARLADLWMELAMDEEETQQNGMAFLLDMDGLPMRLFKFMTPKHAIICALKEEVIVDCN